MRSLLIALFLIGCAHHKPLQATTPQAIENPTFSHPTEEMAQAPQSVRATAKELFKKAIADYSAGFYEDAIEGLDKSFQLSKNYVILYNRAIVNKKMKRYDDATWDLMMYFAFAPPAKQTDEDLKYHKEAREQLRQIAVLKGNTETSGRHVGQLILERMQAGDYRRVADLDSVLMRTHDTALFYWYTQAEYHEYKQYCRDKLRCADPHFNRYMFERLRAFLNVYFLGGSSDRQDMKEAKNLDRTLVDELERVNASRVHGNTRRDDQTAVQFGLVPARDSRNH